VFPDGKEKSHIGCLSNLLGCGKQEIEPVQIKVDRTPM